MAGKPASVKEYLESLPEERRKATLALEGTGWEGDLDAMRRSEIPEL